MTASPQTIVEAQRRRRRTLALAWLHAFRHDPELAALLDAADVDDCLDRLYWLIAWSADRGLLLHPDHLDRNGDPVPF